MLVFVLKNAFLLYQYIEVLNSIKPFHRLFGILRGGEDGDIGVALVI